MKSLKVISILIGSLFLSSNVSAQAEFSKWYFGNKAGLDFITSPPTVLINGSVTAGEGTATMSDGQGNLLFSTDGVIIFNSNHNAMANGLGLMGNGSTTQSAMIVKQPGSSHLYYVFTIGVNGQASGYSIVDMNLAAGMGSVTVKNSTLHTSSCEKQVAVQHCNGKDVWIITHDHNSNQFRNWRLTASGILPVPVISAIGETPGGNGTSTYGQFKISPDGKKLAMASFSSSIPNTLGQGGFFLFDFDAASGIVSNSLTLLSNTAIAAGSGAYGMEFSPDGSKLYGASSAYSNTNNVLYQWNICAGSNAAIVASQYSLSSPSSGSLQWAIDGKIYVAHSVPGGGSNLSVIHNPNGSGAAMNFSLFGQSVAPKLSGLGLPNYINSYTKPAPQPFTSTIACQQALFAAPPVPTFSSGCSATPYPPSAYVWDFGDPASGAANSSTLTKPSHSYTALGTYTVSLVLQNPCSNDTLYQVVNITTLGPDPQVEGIFNICKGDKRTYTVTGGSSYLWSNGATTPTVSLNPTQNAVYTVSATSNGCTLVKSFSLTVSNCTGIDQNDTDAPFRFYPNPVKELLSVETRVETELLIFDLNGRLLQQTHVKAGKSSISTAGLSPGVYLLQAQGGEVLQRARLVVME